jgi:TetR/AcrR family transcriptional regulator
MAAMAKTRIQATNKEAILDAALEVFSAYGFRGTTVDQIAAKAGMSKPNLLYYFRRKQDIYVAVLERTLDDWLVPLRALDAHGDPVAEIARYISAKMELAKAKPAASRLFANEILHGAPMIGPFLKGPLKELVDEKADLLRRWSAAGKIAVADPYLLIFAIWAVTQHYADFDVQIRAILGERADRLNAAPAVVSLIIDGLRRRD